MQQETQSYVIQLTIETYLTSNVFRCYMKLTFKYK